ncbi:MAG: SAM-dependent methyltransferase [Thermodesulfobacteriota bacterium]
MNELIEIIKGRIQKSGPITFAAFMELALYEQEYGYYSSDKARIGKEGDFYTSPCVHPGFGEIIGRFIHKVYKTVDVQEFTVIEMGAGKGYLALDVLDSIKRDQPDLYSNLNYLIVEISPTLMEEEKSILKDHMRKIKFLSSISEIEDEEVAGVFISNELLDSFPFHRLKYTKNGFQEIYVGLRNDEFTEILDTLSASELKTYIDRYGLEFMEGQEIEINLNAKQWLRNVSRILVKGFVVTIDYGFKAPELFDPIRTTGTYMCFYKHEANENPYARVGEQDITAHVDFSNLVLVGNDVELETVKYTTQGQFLIDWGILDILERYNLSNKADELSYQKDILAIKNLFLPDLMGGKFKVLIQAKNLKNKISTFYPESPLKISFENARDKDI